VVARQATALVARCGLLGQAALEEA
jgi:hypothetical protein